MLIANDSSSIHLNVYRDPWINAVYCDEHEDILSLRDCFVQATDIKSLDIKDAQYALDKTVPYTLLTMLLARVFHPDHDEKLDMLDEGIFDVEKIDEYIQNCEARDISFDVFDDHKPFLQDPDYKNRVGIKQLTVGIIDPLMVSGNNTVFYHNKNYNTGGKAVEDTLYMTPPQFIVSVARNHMYHNWSGGSCSTGYTPMQPPLHCIIHGKNLFDTLIISIPPNAHGIPLWERQYDLTIPEIENIYDGTLDYLSAALLPTTSIHFGDIENGIIKNIYYKGNIYKDKKRETSKPREFYNKFFVKEDVGISLFLLQSKNDKVYPLVLNDTTDIVITTIQIMKDINKTGDIEFIKELDNSNILDYVVYGGKLSCKSDEPQSIIISIPIPAALIKENQTNLKKIAIHAEDVIANLKDKLRALEQEIQNAHGKSIGASGAVWTIIRHFSEYASDQLTKLNKGTWLDRIVNDPTDKTVDVIIAEMNREAMKAFYSYRTKYILESGKYASYLHTALYGDKKEEFTLRKERKIKMLSQEQLDKFFENIFHLSKGEKVALARNHSLFENANYNTVIALMKCIPDNVILSARDRQILLFVASICCELGYEKATWPSDAIATVIKKMQGGDIKMSDLLSQDVSTGRVYPLMRKYLSMYKNPVDVYALYYNLSLWDEDSRATRYKWASTWAKISKK